LDCLQDFTPARNIQAPVSVWPSASASWSAITGGSGSNPNPDKDRLSDSRSPSEDTQARPRRHILIVEDNRADLFLIRDALGSAGVDVEVHVAEDGEKALRFLDAPQSDESAPCPALVILDINLPRKKGGDILRHIRQLRRGADALVLVVTSSDSVRDREEMDRLGTNGYFRKPSEYADFMKLGHVVKVLLSREETAPV
jgi:two-component system, chemotaxis family, response regulator Rcp1